MNSTNWEHRFHQVADELDQANEHLKESHEGAKQAMQTLIRATEGLDPTLDQHLQPVLKLSKARGELNLDELKSKLKAVSDYLLHQDQNPEDKPEAKALIGWLGSLPMHKRQEKAKQKLIEKIRKGRFDLEEILQRSAELIKPYLENEPTGFMQRMFGKDSGESAATAEVPEPAYDETPHSPITLQAAMLQLLDTLTLPSSLVTQANALKDKLEHDVDDDDWGKIFHDIAGLFLGLRSLIEQEKRDFERFLEELTANLQELDQSLTNVGNLHPGASEIEIRLDQAALKEVQNIESSIEQAKDLETLKASVQQRIGTLRHHMTARQDAEKKRTEEYQSNILNLNTRVQQLEQETGDLRTRMKKTREQAMRDPLTHLPNRLAYDERLAQEFARWKRFGQPLAVAIWDIDKFKSINDTFGHKVGDKALQLIAKLLSDGIRETDFIARFGGEEFVLLLPGTGLPVAMDVLNKIRERIAKAHFKASNQEINITISCGVSEYRPGDQPDTALERADKALYAAKHNGRNRCEEG